MIALQYRNGRFFAAANGAQEILLLMFELFEIRTYREVTIGHDEPPSTHARVRRSGRKEVRKNLTCEIQPGGLGPSRGRAAPCAPAGRIP